MISGPMPSPRAMVTGTATGAAAGADAAVLLAAGTAATVAVAAGDVLEVAMVFESTPAGAVVLGVSFDGQASHQKFIAKYSLPFALLSDLEKSVATAYDVYKEKSMYGRKYMGIERSTFVIDAAGTLKAIFRKVKVDGHVDEVLDALRA